MPLGQGEIAPSGQSRALADLSAVPTRWLCPAAPPGAPLPPVSCPDLLGMDGLEPGSCAALLQGHPPE